MPTPAPTCPLRFRPQEFQAPAPFHELDLRLRQAVVFNVWILSPLLRPPERLLPRQHPRGELQLRLHREGYFKYIPILAFDRHQGGILMSRRENTMRSVYCFRVLLFALILGVSALLALGAPTFKRQDHGARLKNTEVLSVALEPQWSLPANHDRRLPVGRSAQFPCPSPKSLAAPRPLRFHLHFVRAAGGAICPATSRLRPEPYIHHLPGHHLPHFAHRDYYFDRPARRPSSSPSCRHRWYKLQRPFLRPHLRRLLADGGDGPGRVKAPCGTLYVCRPVRTLSIKTRASIPLFFTPATAAARRSLSPAASMRAATATPPRRGIRSARPRPISRSRSRAARTCISGEVSDDSSGGADALRYQWISTGGILAVIACAKNPGTPRIQKSPIPSRMAKAIRPA